MGIFGYHSVSSNDNSCLFHQVMRQSRRLRVRPEQCSLQWDLEYEVTYEDEDDEEEEAQDDNEQTSNDEDAKDNGDVEVATDALVRSCLVVHLF